jgi:hypothetical protein
MKKPLPFSITGGDAGVIDAGIGIPSEEEMLVKMWGDLEITPSQWPQTYAIIYFFLFERPF